MLINNIHIPRNIRGITVDLWGTLLDDSRYVNQLNNERCKLLTNISNTFKLNINNSISINERLLSERNRFQGYEKQGEFLNRTERIGYLTNYKLSHDNISIVSKEMDILSLKYRPAINYKLLSEIKNWKKKYKCALISNTGMVSSITTRRILNEYGILDLFDEIILKHIVK